MQFERKGTLKLMKKKILFQHDEGEEENVLQGQYENHKLKG